MRRKRICFKPYVSSVSGRNLQCCWRSLQVVATLYAIVILCNENYRVSDHECVECAPGTYNSSGDDASGPDTVCDTIQCAENEYVSNHTCQACPAGTYNTAGDLLVVPTLYAIVSL